MSHRALYLDKIQETEIKFGVVLKDKLRIHMSLMTMESLGRSNVLTGTVFDMLSFSAIRTAVSGSDQQEPKIISECSIPLG